MVMKKNVMRKNLGRSIKNSLGRYIAIVAIIALGAGLFVGLLAAKTDMVETGSQYMRRQNMYDLRLLSTYGWTQTELDEIARMDAVEEAEGVISFDVIGRMGEEADDAVYQVYSIPETINKVYLCGGRMPEAPNECLADAYGVGDAILGTTFYIADTNEADTLDNLNGASYTVVGYVNSPLFMDMTRGNTTLGSGSISAFVYLPKEAFNVEYYTQIDITIPGEHEVYTDAFNDAMDAAAEELEPLLAPLAQQRYEQVLTEGEAAYAEGSAELEDAAQEYEQAKQEAQEQLEAAYQELSDAQSEINANRQLLEDGQLQLEEAQALVDANAQTLTLAAQTLAQSKAEVYAQLADANSELLANYKTVSASQKEVENGLSQLTDGLLQIESGISQLESGLEQMDLMIALTDTLIGVMDTSIQTAQSALELAKQTGTLNEDTLQSMEDRLQELKDKKAGYVQQQEELSQNRETYATQLEELYVQQAQLNAQKTELEALKITLEDAMEAIDQGFLELQNSQLQADNRFTAAEAELEAGQLQIEAAQKELDSKAEELEAGLAALEEAERQLNDGWEEYFRGKETAERELADARQQLNDARQELADARETLDTLEAPQVYILDRNTNAGYIAVDNNSDIVAGVSRVFPVFFLLVAALVCITTMTRMVEEERTQIGTLKALGYSNAAIISKYLFYAGSAAVIGCGLGVFVGSIVFPEVLWSVYKIILILTPDLKIVFNIPLCVGVVAAYTAVMLLVTWYSCRRALREVPAELMRPKAPTSGKKIFLEYLPFWEHFSFLNKVMLRNIFRYRQRLLMMLLGVGGCTALLVTGFGLGDSIKDIVSYQFEEVTMYDMQVQFKDGRTEEEQIEFRNQTSQDASTVVFAHQSSVELDFDNSTKSIYLIAAESDIKNIFDFHSGNQQLTMPGTGQALLSVGAADALGIMQGDVITLRDSDMNMLTVTVSGVFDNNVYNYVIVSPQTIEAQWGALPECQIAYLGIREDRDAHEVGADISAMDGVMNVMISQDIADTVGSMLEAMDLIVVTVIVCAMLLAAIVLYNLTNINITERIREIATIKVLGFHSGETAAYVFKENLLLSAIGSLLGLVGGKFLLDFVMSQIKVEYVWMQARMLPLSMVYSVLITILMACLVDFVLYFRLEKINMAEALKSVE